MSVPVAAVNGLAVTNGEISVKLFSTVRPTWANAVGGPRGAPYRRPASAQFADLAGEREVLGGEAACGVGDQVQRHLVPGDDGDVRVVVRLLGQVADRVDVKQRVTEVLAGHRPGEPPVRHVPAGGRAEFRRDLL